MRMNPPRGPSFLLGSRGLRGRPMWRRRVSVPPLPWSGPIGRRLAVVAVAAGLWFGALVARAQEEAEEVGPIDALEARLAEAAPSERLDLLLALARGYENVDLDRAAGWLEQARALARTPAETLRVDIRAANQVRRRGDYVEALRLTHDVLDRARAFGAKEMELELLVMLGNTLRLMSDFDTAVESYQAALRLGAELGRTRERVQAEAGIAIVHTQSEDWAAADAHFQRALALTADAPASLNRAWVLNGLGRLRVEQKDFAGGRQAHEEALSIRRELGSRIGEADSLLNLSVVEQRQGRWAEARAQAEAALDLYCELGLKANQTNARLVLTRLYLRAGDVARAGATVEAARPLATSLGNKSIEALFYGRSAEVAEARGDLATALAMSRRRANLDQEIVGEKSRLKLAALSARYDLERKEAHIAELKAKEAEQAAELRARSAELARARALQVASGAGVVAVLAIAVSLVFSQRAQRRADRQTLAETQIARRAAEEANALKTRLVGVASHDLKGPLHVLGLRARRIRETGLVEEAARIEAESARLLRLVHDLLDVSALESNPAVLRNGPLELDAFVAGMVADQQPRAQVRGLQLVFRSAGAPVSVVADAEKLHQALFNLLDNALKFTPSGRAVEVKVSTRDAEARIEVGDEGPGLGPEDLARMFQPFQTLSARPQDRESSTGLGLYIAREVVSRHHGRIEVDSQPGQGARFTIILPLPVPAAVAAV